MHKALSVVYFILFLIFLSPIALCIFGVMDLTFLKGLISCGLSAVFFFLFSDEQRVVNAKIIADDIERRMRGTK